VWFPRYPRGQTDRHTHRQTDPDTGRSQAYSSQYFATANTGEVAIQEYVTEVTQLYYRIQSSKQERQKSNRLLSSGGLWKNEKTGVN